LSSGFRPPIGEGFNRFSSAERVARAIDQHVAQEHAEGKTDPYDTHPPLRERIAALVGLERGGELGDSAPAVSLLTGVETLEVDLLRALSSQVADLKPVQWQDTATTVYLPLWKAAAEWDADALRGLTLSTVPEATAAEGGIPARLRLKQGEAPTAEQRRAKTVFVIGAAIAIQLHQLGWRISALPGEAVCLECDGVVVKPFDMVSALMAGTMTAEAWRDQCATAGIGGLELYAAPADPLSPAQ
jgi:hypothetical protein